MERRSQNQRTTAKRFKSTYFAGAEPINPLSAALLIAEWESGSGPAIFVHVTLNPYHRIFDRNEKPPSTGMAVPVTKSEAGLARKIAMPARSSGVPQRPAGIRYNILSLTDGVLQIALCHIRGDKAWENSNLLECCPSPRRKRTRALVNATTFAGGISRCNRHGQH